MQQVPLKTYINTRKTAPILSSKPINKGPKIVALKREPLTTKKAIEFLLAGTLKNKVCRYCLNIDELLFELDQYMNIAGREAMYRVTIRDMVAAIHPFKVVTDHNFPNKICNKCLDEVIRCYLFAQQCEQSERATRNCFDDMFEKFEKLDSIEKKKKRGRQKQNPNHNILYTEHLNVIDYAEPLHNLINSGAIPYTKETELSPFECKKCWQVLPNIESLVNHEKSHPQSMWYFCRLCGKAFAKNHHLKKHIKKDHSSTKNTKPNEFAGFECKQCSAVNENHILHLQHLEKHKFQMVLEHVIERKMDKLCAVCLDKGPIVDLDTIIYLHGGYPELTGEKTIYNLVGATLPEMNIIQDYTGSQICNKCLDHAIISYVFINRINYVRNRLGICITKMLDNLKDMPTSEDKIFIEISQNGILPILEEDCYEDLLSDVNEDIDETKLKVDVLEDEYRLKSESENSDIEENIKHNITNSLDTTSQATSKLQQNLVNGYQLGGLTKIDDVCSEFLTFKKKRKCKATSRSIFSCPQCNKHFISEYFVKRHILKHVNKKVKCNVCSQGFNSKFCLYEHVKFVHLLKEQYSITCEICGRKFADDNKHKIHMKIHMDKECQFCTKTYVTQKYYDCHMQRHAIKLQILKQKNNIQTCSFCEKECPNDNILSLHVNKVHLQIKPFSCDMCEKQYYTEMNLKSHKKVHNLKTKEKCEFCGKLLQSRKRLVIHVRKHIGVKPYKCFLCSQRFYSEMKLTGHMKKWHGGSFCCKLCKKVFMNRNELKNHVNFAHSVF